MSGDDVEQTNQGSDDQQRASSETPELSPEGKEEVQRMVKEYDDSRQTAVLPGSEGTITGTAINEWLDDEGNPKFGKDKPQDAPENG